ncbi:MAG TPA: hypothetical protein PLA50_03835, partial [Bacteroidia bacterium]|nr:hypothetical protein [Bacteroidia bacterium]
MPSSTIEGTSPLSAFSNKVGLVPFSSVGSRLAFKAAPKATARWPSVHRMGVMPSLSNLAATAGIWL